MNETGVISRHLLNYKIIKFCLCRASQRTSNLPIMP